MIKQIACVLALAATVPAAAETRAVRYDDLNLASIAGIQRLEQRIHSAARDVCGADASRQTLAVQAATQKCMTEAKASAMAQVARLDTRAARGG